jgi:hypothetical protein
MHGNAKASMVKTIILFDKFTCLLFLLPLVLVAQNLLVNFMFSSGE